MCVCVCVCNVCFMVLHMFASMCACVCSVLIQETGNVIPVGDSLQQHVSVASMLVFVWPGIHCL